MVAKELKAAGCEVTDHIGKYDQPGLTGYGVVGVMKNGDGPVVLVRTDMDALPVRGGNRPALCEQGDGEKQRRRGSARDARLRPRHAHRDLHRRGARAGEAEGPMARHDHLRRPTGRGSVGRRARDVEGRALHTFPETEFRARLSRQRATSRPTTSASPPVTPTRTSIRSTSPCPAWAATAPTRTRRRTRSCSRPRSSTCGRRSRAAKINPLDPVVVTVGSIHGGTKHNIIPNEVKMQLTVRTYKSEVREQVLAAIERIAKGCAVAGGWPEDKMPKVEVSTERVRALDLQQSRADETAGRCLETVVRREERRDRRSDDGRRRFFGVQPAGSLDPGGRFSCRRGRSGENRGLKKAGRAATAKFALEQVRARAGADHPHWTDRDDERGPGFDEEVGVNALFVLPDAPPMIVLSSRLAANNTYATSRMVGYDPVLRIRFAPSK